MIRIAMALALLAAEPQPQPHPMGVDTEQLASNILLHLDWIAERHPEVDRQELVESILFQTLSSAQKKRAKVKANDLISVLGEGHVAKR